MLSEYEQNLLERLMLATETIAEHLATIAVASDRSTKLVSKLVNDGRGALLVQNRGN
jgi:hypothetical protein